jgi:hypothetical protein
MPGCCLQQQWNIDPRDKEVWEGLGIEGRTITALGFGVGIIVSKPFEEKDEGGKIRIITICPVISEQFEFSNV